MNNDISIEKQGSRIQLDVTENMYTSIKMIQGYHLKCSEPKMGIEINLLLESSTFKQLNRHKT